MDTIAIAIAKTFVGIVSIIASILADISVSNCRYYRGKICEYYCWYYCAHNCVSFSGIIFWHNCENVASIFTGILRVLLVASSSVILWASFVGKVLWRET